MQLRDYQLEAIVEMCCYPRSLLHGPAGCGKTVIGAHLIAGLSRRSERKLHIGWVCNTVEQKEQAITALRAVEPENCDLYVSCAASQPDCSFYDVLIIDECHHIPAESWFHLIKYVNPKAVIWGLTATPDHPDPARNAMTQAVFPHRVTIDRARILASGHLVPGTVYMHDVDVPGEFDAAIETEALSITRQRIMRFRLVSPAEHLRRARWQVTQEYLQKNEKRNQKAMELAQGSLSTLVLVHSIEHGEKLAAGVPGSFLVHSKVGAKARRELISGFRAGSHRVLFSTSLADEGLDVPRASVLVLAAGGRSAGKLEQRAGRVLRPFEGKTGGVIHDFLDRGCLFGHAQAKARMKVYEKLGYNPVIMRDGAAVPPEPVRTAPLPGWDQPDLTGDWSGFR